MRKLIRKKSVIGRKDKVDFPELDLIDIDVKIDTGAFSSAIHCHNIEIIDSDTAPKVRFNLLDPSHPDYDEKEFLLPVHSQKPVKSSSGEIENRIFIKTKILIFGKMRPIQLSLTDRSDMKFPVLIGRKLLKGKFVVDVAKRDLSFLAKYKSRKRKSSR